MKHPLIIDSNGKIYKHSRFVVIDRAIQKACDQIMAQEDARIFEILDAIAESGNKEE